MPIDLEDSVNIWGERYAEVSLFEGYCRDQNVNPDRGELEHYEKIGAMLPVARVVYPDQYVVQMDKNQRNGVTDWGGGGPWPEQGRGSSRVCPLPESTRDLSLSYLSEIPGPPQRKRSSPNTG